MPNYGTFGREILLIVRLTVDKDADKMVCDSKFINTAISVKFTKQVVSTMDTNDVPEPANQRKTTNTGFTSCWLGVDWADRLPNATATTDEEDVNTNFDDVNYNSIALLLVSC